MHEALEAGWTLAPDQSHRSQQSGIRAFAAARPRTRRRGLYVAIQSDHGYKKAYYNRYSARIEKDDKEGALADIEAWLNLARLDHTSADALSYAVNLGNAARLQQLLNHPAEAAKRWEASASMLAELLGADDKQVLAAKFGLAQTYADLSRFDDAEKLVKAILASKEASLGTDHSDLVEVLNELAIVAMGKAQYAQAEEAAKRALSIADRAEGVDVDIAAKALGNLASIYQAQHRYDEAQDIDLRVLALAERRSGPESVDVAQLLGNLANLYADTGRYREAERANQRAMRIFEKSYGPDDPNVAQALSNIAAVYRNEQRYNDAEIALKRSLIIQEKAFGPDNDRVGGPLSNLGAVLLDEVRPVEAEAFFARFLAIEEKTYGPEHPRVAKALQNLSHALDIVGRHEEASRLLTRAQTIFENVHGSSGVELASVLNELGSRALDAGRAGEADTVLRRALANVNQTPQADRSVLASSIYNLGRLAKTRGQWREAEARFTEQLKIKNEDCGPDCPSSVFTVSELASLAEEQRQWRRALDLRRRAAEIAIKAASVQPADRAAKLLAFASEGIVASAWPNARQDPALAPALAGEAFVAIQRTQLGTAASAVSQMATRFGAGSGAIAAAVGEQQDLSARAQALDRVLTAAIGSADATRRSEDGLAHLRSQIADVETRLKDVDARIAHDFPHYAELASPRPLTLVQTQSLLRPDEVLVTWLFLNKESFVFAITKEGSNWRRIDLGAKALGDAVTKLRDGLDFDKVSRGLAAGKPGREVVFDLAASHALHDELLGPVQGLVQQKKTLVVVPSGVLTSLLLQVLVTEPPKRAATSLSDTAYARAAWLARTHAITVLPSVDALRALRAFVKPSQATRPLVGFADPVFARGTHGEARGLAKNGMQVAAYSRYFRGGAVDVDALRRGLPALPETAGELRAVAGELHAGSADLEFGEDASVSKVKALPLDTFKVVYFATHGLVAGDVQGLSEPALALTIPAHPTDADSGLLTASDVAQLKLDADWVVLSACNTASGDTPGAEGLSGLARAFFYAGARALLVSHWPV